MIGNSIEHLALRPKGLEPARSIADSLCQIDFDVLLDGEVTAQLAVQNGF
jgi:hypothetical protein